MSRSLYACGFDSIGEDAATATPADLMNAAKALSLLDAALAEAKKLVADETTSTWSKLKALATGVDLDAAKNQVTTLERDVGRMHDVESKFDNSTTHAKVLDFVSTCYQLADLSVLKDSVNRNQLGALVKEVGASTAADVVHHAQEASKGLWSSLWDPLPWWGKVLFVGVPAAAVFTGIKRKIEEW